MKKKGPGGRKRRENANEKWMKMERVKIRRVEKGQGGDERSR